jgi:hypothetical protein
MYCKNKSWKRADLLFLGLRRPVILKHPVKSEGVCPFKIHSRKDAEQSSTIFLAARSRAFARAIIYFNERADFY